MVGSNTNKCEGSSVVPLILKINPSILSDLPKRRAARLLIDEGRKTPARLMDMIERRRRLWNKR